MTKGLFSRSMFYVTYFMEFKVTAFIWEYQEINIIYYQ